MHRLILVALTLALAAPGALAQVTSAPAEPQAAATDFDFLEGSWTVVYNSKQPGVPPDVPGTWEARKQADGRVLYDEFRLFGPGGKTVVLGATFRVFDGVRHRWDMRYVGLVAPGPGGETTTQPAQWAELTAWREGSTIRVDHRGRSIWLRITYYDITRDHFRWKADVSSDEGKTWQTDQIQIEATRAR